MIKVVSRLKKFFVRPRKKRRRKTYPFMYHESSRYYDPPPPPPPARPAPPPPPPLARPTPPQPPYGYYCPYYATSTEPSAPPLPPWLDITIDQTQDGISELAASETDYPSQTHFSFHEIVAETSPICRTLLCSNNNSTIPSPSSYHQYMNPNPAAGVPVLHQELIRQKQRLSGFFRVVIDFFGCFCPCFGIPYDSEKPSIN